MSPQTRRVVNRLPRERRERDILAAATAVFSERGYENASMAEIAARAGVVEGTIYKYFSNKRDLMLQVLSRWYENMLANYEEHLAGIKGTESRLRYVIWRHLAFIQAHPALCRVFFREVRTGGDYDSSALHELNRRYTHLAVAILREGFADGDLKPGLSLPLIRDLIYGTIEHHTWRYVCGSGSLDAEAIADQLCLVLFGGIAADKAANRLEATAARLENVAERLAQSVAAASVPVESEA
ncbi:TetR/AcrR family transcriptional regulator [Rhodoligotrophos defluvii]|uniref:TetR/AcrR family transcriptional regulator n=1 Tax=Rhodoligotrophos defluvii TaxID=2561934 RepID=UPI0014850CED|nr:TetR/AcrR family transcriptional regulator [Rhodoligotrophos defluvii]